MSYLVLARKWRPRDFESLVGQDHVVRALTHALTTQRLHHAWLFTGTRGVGKTTLSRILAKSLNCETGITAKPCGQCTACTEIDNGRFVDYVELDAASNRGVEEMTQLLEQAIYAPSMGRFKVYMIDEVHMLSGHAFNAMLKTLEEPPPHVKFIIATTDPQKIPPTVLSRCLQFNLKQMPPEAVVQYLDKVLSLEQVPFEQPALRLIGLAAAGSMRDALSLTDQAIAYSSGHLTLDAVRTMLGAVDQTYLKQLLIALSQGDASALLEVADALAVRGISFKAALGDLSVLLSQMAIEQRVAGDADDLHGLDADLKALAKTLPPDVLQLFYTVAVHGRQELAIAPDEYAGFMMVCLKMLSFVTPVQTELEPAHDQEAEKKSLKSDLEGQSEPTKPIIAAQPARVTPPIVGSEPSFTDSVLEPVLTWAGDTSLADWGSDRTAESTNPGCPESSNAADKKDSSQPDSGFSAVLDERFVKNWPEFARQLPLSGMAQQLATQSACVRAQADALTLQVSTQALAAGTHVQRLKKALDEQLGRSVQLKVVVGEVSDGASAQSIDDAVARELQRQAEQIVANDAFVQGLINTFDGHVVPGSVKPWGDDGKS
jgi:DNA polymerase III subunit gamma/tau